MSPDARWTLARDVRASDLPADARLIMHVLADIVEQEPPKHGLPSTARVAREAGLTHQTVERHWAALETAGWIDRVRCSR